jgi:hypothetical protein
MSILRMNCAVWTRVQCVRIFFSRVYSMDQMPPELGPVLQTLSSNGNSIFSLMDYILASHNPEDQRIKPLREGMERDTANICILLLSHNPAGFDRVLDFGIRRAQCMCSIFSAGPTGPQQVLSWVYSQEVRVCGHDQHSPGQCLPGNIQLWSTPTH